MRLRLPFRSFTPFSPSFRGVHIAVTEAAAAPLADAIRDPISIS